MIDSIEQIQELIREAESSQDKKQWGKANQLWDLAIEKKILHLYTGM